ncbi:MAG: endopeptidase La [Eubacterium sp.]|nr:endopeptidase La [Eubacterium sp.]
MILIPLYDTVLLPDVSFIFRKEIIDSWDIDELSVGDEIHFAFFKEDKPGYIESPDDIYPIVVSARIESIDSEGGIRIRTIDRLNISNIIIDDDEITADLTVRPDIEDISPKERDERFEKVKNALLNFVQDFQWGLFARGLILQWKNMNELCSAMLGYFNMTWEEKYAIIEADSVDQRYKLIEDSVFEFVEMSRVHSEAEDAQMEEHEKLYRESALKKQISILQQELDAMHPESISDVALFRKKIDESGMNDTARKEADKILNRMKQEGQDGHEYGMLYDYLDFVTSLEWHEAEPEEIDLGKVEEILDEDHFGLKKVKERIVQQMAVMALNRKQSGSILLFVGPPGTGKTSIGQSIARALGREYVRISLGGIRDEAEIRGHRRTYIGAMPGRIMEGMKRSGSNNPVMVLDEVDKLVRDFSGDPSSALLEVLDPEQNFSFTDHYMNVPYDLSNVLFVCTANTVDTIPEPLLNRMEVIEFNGYTASEKFSIAKKHLIPKAYKQMGLMKKNLNITDAAVKKIIEEYTAEAGVRGLKKQIDNLCRSAAVKLVKGVDKKISVTPKNLREYLGRRVLHHDIIEGAGTVGIVTGLAWTAAGGEILFIETAIRHGSGKIIITGQLGDVMKESVEIAISLIKGIYPKETEKLSEYDLHIHVPEGAVPKDGPSAGITITTALASLFTGVKVDPHIAMTGEVSLRGNVMPIGGLTEKLMAALRAGVKKVYIPDKNVEDLEDVPEEVKDALTIIPVKRVKDVLKECIVDEK